MGIRIKGLQYLHMPPMDLHVQPGTCTGITGPSGVGKSLFLKSIADLIPHAGDVYLGDMRQSETLAPVWRRKISMLPAQSAWWFDTVGPHFSTINPEQFEALGFSPDIATWSIRRLSSGEKQRLAILRLLANQPEAMLLDEPTANLDEQNTRNAEILLTNYFKTRHIPVIWISHSRKQLLRVADNQMELTQEGLREQTGAMG